MRPDATNYETYRIFVTLQISEAEKWGWWRPTYPSEYVIPQLSPSWFGPGAMELLQLCYRAGEDGLLERDVEYPIWGSLRCMHDYGLVQVRSVVMLRHNNMVYSRVFICTEMGRAVAELDALQSEGNEKV